MPRDGRSAACLGTLAAVHLARPAPDGRVRETAAAGIRSDAGRNDPGKSWRPAGGLLAGLDTASRQVPARAPPAGGLEDCCRTSPRFPLSFHNGYSALVQCSIIQDDAPTCTLPGISPDRRLTARSRSVLLGSKYN